MNSSRHVDGVVCSWGSRTNPQGETLQHLLEGDRIASQLSGICQDDVYAPSPQIIREFLPTLSSPTAETFSGLLVLPSFEEIEGFLMARSVLGEVELDYIAVRPESLRKGYGRKLMTCFVSLCQESLTSRILLEVGEKNIKAISLYASLGFAEVGRRRKYYRTGEDALVMELRLEINPSVLGPF